MCDVLCAVQGRDEAALKSIIQTQLRALSSPFMAVPLAISSASVLGSYAQPAVIEELRFAADGVSVAGRACLQQHYACTVHLITAGYTAFQSRGLSCQPVHPDSTSGKGRVHANCSMQCKGQTACCCGCLCRVAMRSPGSNCPEHAVLELNGQQQHTCWPEC